MWLGLHEFRLPAIAANIEAAAVFKRRDVPRFLLKGIGAMRSDCSTGDRMTACLASNVEDDSSADQIAAACGALWMELDSALSPIIGPRGVIALGQRSLHLASAVHPWLAACQPGGPATLDSALLVSLLARKRAIRDVLSGVLTDR